MERGGVRGELEAVGKVQEDADEAVGVAVGEVVVDGKTGAAAGGFEVDSADGGEVVTEFFGEIAGEAAGQGGERYLDARAGMVAVGQIDPEQCEAAAFPIDLEGEAAGSGVQPAAGFAPAADGRGERQAGTGAEGRKERMERRIEAVGTGRGVAHCRGRLAGDVVAG